MPELTDNTKDDYPSDWTEEQIRIMQMIEELHRRLDDASSNIDGHSDSISSKLDEITARLDAEIAAIEAVQRKYQ